MSNEQHTQYRSSVHAPGAMQFPGELESDRQSPPEPRTLWCSRLKAHRSAPVLGLVAVLTLLVLGAACGGDTSSGIGAGDRDSGADADTRTDTHEITDAAADSVPDAPDLELSSSDGDVGSERDANQDADFDTFTEPDTLPELDVAPESDLLPELDASDATVDGFGDPDVGGLDVAADAGADGRMDSGVDAPADTTNTTDTSGAADLADAGTPAALRDLRILVIGQSDFSPRGTAHYLAELFEAHGARGMTTAAYVVTHDLLEYFYVWRAREERLVVFADDWDFIVLMDASNNQTRSPEIHFEGVRALAELSREHGALPILVTTVDAEPGSLDEELAWRVGLGAGCIVAPASVVASGLSAPPGEHGIVAAATIFTALTGETAAVAGYLPDAANQARWGEIAEAVLVQHEVDEVTTHYVGDFAGVVRLDNMVGDEPYRFISSGTSSEWQWAGAMGAMLEHEGIAYEPVHLSCNSSRIFDATYRDSVEPYLRADVYQVLYARHYSVSAASIHEQSETWDIMPQVYDRHSDGDRDGSSGLNYIRRQSQDTYDLAARLGLSWLPQHINFGRIKVEQPDTPLSNDGTHATSSVQRGLAAMSFVSRTGRAPRQDGLEQATERAVRHGEQTIRQLATLSRTGETIADHPDSRVTAPAIDLSDEPVFPDPPYYGEYIALPPWEDELGVPGEDMCLLSFQSLDPPSYARPPDATECFDVDLGSNTGQVTFNPCWHIPDRIYRWTAPTDGRWVFRTVGPPEECADISEGDPMLRIAQPHCDGDTFAENDDDWERSRNRFDAYTKLDLAEGQSVYIEHSHLDRGILTSNLYVYRIDVERLFCDDEVDNDFDMRIDCSDPDCLGAQLCPDTCPTVDLGSAVGPGVGGGTVEGQSDLYPFCNRAPSWWLTPDVSLRWVAPVTGRYQFDTIGSSGDEGLTILRGPCDCGGTGDVLGCGIWSDYDELNAIVTVDVTVGEELTLLINAWGGASWVLNVTEVTQ